MDVHAFRSTLTRSCKSITLTVLACMSFSGAAQDVSTPPPSPADSLPPLAAQPAGQSATQENPRETGLPATVPSSDGTVPVSLSLVWRADSLRFNNQKVVDSVEPGELFSLRLSAELVDRATNASARIQQEVQRLAPGEPLNVRVVPIFTDGKFIPYAGVTKSIYEILLPAQQRSQTGDVLPEASAWLDIPFLARNSASGCGMVALSLWNASMTQAWDSLLVVFPIKGADDAVTDCATQFGANRGIVSSAAGMVIAPQAMPATEWEPGALNLHAFEISPASGSKQSYVLFLSRGVDGTLRIHGWRMKMTLSGGFGGRELQRLAYVARSKLVNNDRSAYTLLANHMRDVLFTTADRHDETTANEALRILQDTALTKSDTSLSARFSVTGNDDSDLMYVPLRVLAWPAAGIVDTDFELVLPLPRTETVHSCISRWHLLIPTNISDVEESSNLHTLLLKLTQERDLPWKGVTATNLDEYRAFLSSAAPDNTLENEGEGLIILAHNSPGEEGGLSLGGDEMISPVAIKRLFPAGSVALLAACSTAGRGDTGGLIKTLNENNIGSVAASPFTIHTEYGIRLADGLLTALKTAYEQDEPASFRELIARATRIAAESYPSRTPGLSRSEGQQGLELVLLGDPDIRLCRLNQQGE